MLPLLVAVALQAAALRDSIAPPPVMREFRGMWVATVTNMDWPSKATLSTAEQQQELRAILDRAAELHMNAIVFQVRPEADAFYESKYEPWSRFLTGKQGRAPKPFWDPLKFAIDEAHKRGLELHAWFNPYRAAYYKDSARAASHVSQRHPSYVMPYYQYLWMDPGISAVRELMIRSVADVVRRYDVDAVHIDDYFYPYPELNAAKQPIPFPDSKTYAAYRRAGGKLEKADWRRRNVNLLLKEMYDVVKEEKRWVKVGISPFGIWRPGYPPTIEAGIDQYDEIFADARKWLREGWLDYIAPQLYWPVRPAAQSYPVLLKWWVDESIKGRHVWPGLALYKLPITGPRAMSASDIIEEIDLTRRQPGATGHIHFNAAVLMQNVKGIADSLRGAYQEPALVPASPWLDKTPPAMPSARISIDSGVTVRFAPGDEQPIRRWVVQVRSNGTWRTRLLAGISRAHILSGDDSGADYVSVASVDRAGNLSPARVIHIVTERR